MTYLVLGATGLQGGAVARELLRRGASVRALTRNPAAARAQSLSTLGVDLVSGDLNHQSSLDAAFEGISGVFSVQDFYAPDVGLVGEIAQGRNVIAMARKRGVRHIVQSSMGEGCDIGGPAHFLSKAILERDLKRSGVAWTLLGTVWFMDNLLNPDMKPGLMFPVLSGSLARDTLFPMLAISDLGWVAAEALTDPETWRGRKINLAGDVMTVSQMKAAYQRVRGTKPKSWRIPAWAFKRLVPEFAEQLRWHNEVNFSFGVEELLATGRQPTTFEAFLAAQPVERM